MRIIAGAYRRRQLVSPPGLTARPMPDRVKEAVFSMLGLRVAGATVLDCFAGSGAVGLEALSRGAASCIFVEKDRRVGDVLEQNIELLGCGDRASLVRGDALGMSVLARAKAAGPLDLAFFDPPYPLVQTRLGWERVKRQCAAVVELLVCKGQADAAGNTADAPGFLVLRTPLPHLVTEETEGQGDQALADRIKGRRFRPHDKPRRHDWRAAEAAARGADGDGAMIIGGERVTPLRPGELAALGAGGEPAEAGAADEGGAAQEGGATPGGPEVVRSVADWSIPGARGPETHQYGSTAVHLYIRDPRPVAAPG